MFSDGNVSYGIEPVGSGQVSLDVKEEKLVELIVDTHRDEAARL